MTTAARTLLRDPWVISSLVYCLLIAVLYAAPILSPAQFDVFTNSIAMLLWLALAIGATTAGLGTIQNFEERRFWSAIAIACTFWAASEVLNGIGIVDTGEPAGAILVDCLYFLYYVGWLLALEAHPHLEPERRSAERFRSFSWAGRVLFASGLFAYFILLPRLVHIETYTTWFPSFLFYIFLDLYLTTRLAFASGRSKGRRWPALYAILGSATLLIGLTDLIEGLWIIELADPGFGGPVDALWYAPFFLIVLAGRTSRLSITNTKDFGHKKNTPPKGVPLLAYSFALPVLHFLLNLSGFNPPELERAREILILIWLCLLGGMNSVQYFWLGRWNRELQHQQRRAEERVLYLSKRDALTGFLNRRELSPILRDAMATNEGPSNSLALLFVDLDGFKEVNDSFGHSKGDTVLQAVAERIQLCVRDTDNAIRYGGDEFVLVLGGTVDRQVALSVARRILDTLATDLSVDRNPIELSASIGISLFPEDGDTPQALLDAADAAMYRAKADGGARCLFAGDSIIRN